jgi:hypothetical protein
VRECQGVGCVEQAVCGDQLLSCLYRSIAILWLQVAGLSLEVCTVALTESGFFDRHARMRLPLYAVVVTLTAGLHPSWCKLLCAGSIDAHDPLAEAGKPTVEGHSCVGVL